MFNLFNRSFANGQILMGVVFSFLAIPNNAGAYVYENVYTNSQHPDVAISKVQFYGKYEIDNEGNTNLHRALRDHKNDVAEKLLEKNPELVNIENIKQETPIYIADKADNMNGVKLCLEYNPKHMHARNNCHQIFEKVKGAEPYILHKPIYQFYQPEHGENKDKLVIFLIFPGLDSDVASQFSQYFKNSKVPTLIIGNGMHSLSYQLIKSSIEAVNLPQNILLIIDTHGDIDPKSSEHQIFLDNTEYETKTENLFVVLQDIFKSKPIAVLLTACSGSGAIKYVDRLPRGSSLLVFSQTNQTTQLASAKKYFNPKTKDYANDPQNFLQSFLKTHLFLQVENNSIPELAVAGAAKDFDYRHLKKYVGCKLDESQKDSIVSALKEYCDENDRLDGCENRILKVIKKIENAPDIDQLKAPTNIYKNYIYNVLLPDKLSQNYAKESCTDNPSKFYIKTHIDEQFLKLEAEDTDYAICYGDKHLTQELDDACDESLPVRPYFGMALAILYEMNIKDYCK